MGFEMEIKIIKEIFTIRLAHGWNQPTSAVGSWFCFMLSSDSDRYSLDSL